ncbi:MAG: hypothetical protein ACI9BW_004685 [Gammaproteobacteria bacterium]|jgi:hypothetical protein
MLKATVAIPKMVATAIRRMLEYVLVERLSITAEPGFG